jgi:hypothetical protein
MPGNLIEKQSAFSGGEVSPDCYGRTDIPTYKNSLALSKNFLITKRGAAKNRSGTKEVSPCKNTGSAIPPRLIPFVFSDEQAFVLEFGDHYFRVIQDGALVLSPTAAAYSAGTTYAKNALVDSAGTHYVSLVNGNIGNTPVSSPASWKFVSAIWLNTTIYGAGEYVLYSGGVYHSLSGSNLGNLPSAPSGWWELLAVFPPLEVTTPWAIADAMRLKYAQSGDVITIVHPNYAPQDLSRVSNTNWTIAPSLLAPPAWPAGWTVTSPSFHIPNITDVLGNGVTNAVALYLPAPHNYPSVTGETVAAYTTPGLAGGQQDTYFLVEPANQSTIGSRYPSGTSGPLAAPSFFWSLYSFDAVQQYLVNMYCWAQDLTVGALPNLAGVLYKCRIANVGKYPNANIGTYWDLAGDATHPPAHVTYAITMSLRDPRGVLVESLPTYYSPPGGVFPRFLDRPLALQFNPPALPGSNQVTIGGVLYTIEGFQIYVGNGGLYGFVDSIDGSTIVAPTAPFFIDQGGAPNFNTVPPAGTNPFAVPDGSGGTTFSYPGVVTYFQQRRIFARSNSAPNKFWGSVIGNFLDFDTPDFLVDKDAFDFLVAGTKLQEIRSIIAQRELLVFTSSSENVASGSNGGVGGAITPTSIDIRPASQHGASYLDPVVADHSVLSVTALGSYIRDLEYDWRSASYTGRDITSLVRHLFDGHTVVDWLLISLTYEKDFAVVAFAQHTSNAALLGSIAGKFQRGCSVPEGTEDAVYFVVQRSVNGVPTFVIERLSSRVIEGPNGPQDYRQACFLDCALTYNGRNPDPGNNSVLSVDAVTLVANKQFIVTLNNTFPFTANDAAVNNEVVIHPDGIAQSGIDEAPGTPLPPVLLRIVKFTSSREVICELDGPAPKNWGLYTATADWAIARKTFTGLDVLNGNAVAALVDGAVDLGKGGDVVLGGTITLTAPGVDVIIGLPYFSDLETLDSATESIKTSQREVKQVSLEVVDSRAFQAGEDFAHLSTVKPKTTTDGFGVAPLMQGQQQLAIANSWNTNGSVCIRMKDPLPLTIVSLIRDIAVGGK